MNMKRIIFVLCFVFCIWPITTFGAIDYAQIDKYAKEAPWLKNNSNLDRLVKYLVQPYKKDVEKARVLLAWIVYNIDYDGYKLNAMEDAMKTSGKHNRQLFIPNNDILETRLGVCGDIATLYQKMGEIAGLTVSLITGRVRQEGEDVADFDVGPGHVWTAVKIDGLWQFVDPTFAIDGTSTIVMGDVDRKRQYERNIKQRTKRNASTKKPREGRVVDNRWFLINKHELIKTHFPDNERWQLLEKPLSKQEFLGLSDRQYRNLQRQVQKGNRRN